MVGIVGPSGSGKTTIVDLILRLFNPQKGEILADNKNIKVKIYDPKENLTDWEIISKDEILKDYTQLKGKQRIWVYNTSNKPDIWYRQSSNVDKLYVYSSVVIFDDLASSKVN